MIVGMAANADRARFCGRAKRRRPDPFGSGLLGKAPGDDLLLHGLSHTTIGACAFHFRVRDGIGWFHTAIITRERVEGRRLRWIEVARTLSLGCFDAMNCVVGE